MVMEESDMDLMVKAMGADNFKKLQSDMSSIAEKFKERTNRYQSKVSSLPYYSRPADWRIPGSFLASFCSSS